MLPIDPMLIEYGQILLRSVALLKNDQEPAWVIPFMKLLNPNYKGMSVVETPLQAISTLVKIDGKVAKPFFVAPVPINQCTWPGSSDWRLFPRPEPEIQHIKRQDLWDEFVRAGGDSEKNFDRFFALMQIFASTLPNTYGEAGVSLFQQWKLIAALVYISGGTDKLPESLGLVGGDIPGIQRTISLITSKGAAKAMRGRSAFVQLLGHALVKRLIDDLNLSQANVIYDAGGNFLLLTGMSTELKQKVDKIVLEVNRVLLPPPKNSSGFDGFRGDLSVVLAVIRVEDNALQMTMAEKASPWRDAGEKLRDALKSAKVRPFSNLATENDQGWGSVFDPEGADTDQFCAVCRRQPRPKEKFEILSEEAEGISIRSNIICPECKGFNQLADSLGHGGSKLLLKRIRGQEQDMVAWQRCLHAVSGGWVYRVGESQEQGDVTLGLGLGSFPASDVNGVRLMANTTPMNGRDIKPNDELAKASRGGMKRLGVLRMDVDDLGHIFGLGLPNSTITQTSELSQYIERFFAGWLHHICARIDEGKQTFYVLFAGGDDLFIIGPWTEIPILARAIHNDFNAYMGKHPGIHLSAGIAIVGETAPLHAAADEAHDALEVAKNQFGNGKDAVTFLGRPYRWNDFAKVEGFKEDLVNLVSEQGKNLPKSLLTTLMTIALRWQKDRDDARTGEKPPETGNSRPSSDDKEARLFYGPWMWKQAYALHRMGEQHKEAKEELQKLEKDLLSGGIQDLALATRWAQWLTRKEENRDSNN